MTRKHLLPTTPLSPEQRLTEVPSDMSRRSQVQGSGAMRSPDRLVGRPGELAFIDAEWQHARRGKFRSVLLLGEPGVGKTRLANEVLRLSRDRAITLSARAHSLGDTTPMGLWVEALEHHLRSLTASEIDGLCGGVLDDLAVLLPSVAAARGGVPPDRPSGSRFLVRLARIIGNLAHRAPLLILLDDVHLADASSWDCLHYFAHELSDTSILVVLAARPAELADQPGRAQLLLGLEQENLLLRLNVGPLDRQAIGELAETVLEEPPPRVLVEWLTLRSRGNPLFALGLLRALLDEGGDLAAPELRYLPEDLVERVASRLAALDARQRAIGELPLVCGRSVELSSLLKLCGEPLDRLAWILERLVRAHLVAEDYRSREPSYEIAHPLIQDAVYQSVGGARRLALHRLVARALVAAGRVGEAAPHFVRSSDVGDQEAIDALRDAVREAEQRDAYREALSILQALVELLPRGDRRWLEILEAISPGAEWVVDHRARSEERRVGKECRS